MNIKEIRLRSEGMPNPIKAFLATRYRGDDRELINRLVVSSNDGNVRLYNRRVHGLHQILGTIHSVMAEEEK